MSDAYLSEQKALLKKQLFWLEHSFDEATRIGIKQTYAVHEFDTFENLCSRFARMIDMLVRKVFRAIDAAEFETQGTLVDVVNRAHKRKLFDDIETIRTIKDIRNMIAHEYLDDDLAELFEEVLYYTPVLIETAKRTLRYIDETV